MACSMMEPMGMAGLAGLPRRPVLPLLPVLRVPRPTPSAPEGAPESASPRDPVRRITVKRHFTMRNFGARVPLLLANPTEAATVSRAYDGAATPPLPPPPRDLHAPPLASQAGYPYPSAPAYAPPAGQPVLHGPGTAGTAPRVQHFGGYVSAGPAPGRDPAPPAPGVHGGAYQSLQPSGYTSLSPQPHYPAPSPAHPVPMPHYPAAMPPPPPHYPAAAYPYPSAFPSAAPAYPPAAPPYTAFEYSYSYPYPYAPFPFPVSAPAGNSSSGYPAHQGPSVEAPERSASPLRDACDAVDAVILSSIIFSNIL